MKTYTWQPGSTVATVTDADGTRTLNPRFDLRNHSPTGFSYGYGGSGPAQLAVAILADATRDDEAAKRHYQDFQWDIIAHAPQKQPFTITEADVLDWVRRTETPACG